MKQKLSFSKKSMHNKVVWIPKQVIRVEYGNSYDLIRIRGDYIVLYRFISLWRPRLQFNRFFLKKAEILFKKRLIKFHLYFRVVYV